MYSLPRLERYGNLPVKSVYAIFFGEDKFEDVVITEYATDFDESGEVNRDGNASSNVDCSSVVREENCGFVVDFVDCKPCLSCFM